MNRISLRLLLVLPLLVLSSSHGQAELVSDEKAVSEWQTEAATSFVTLEAILDAKPEGADVDVDAELSAESFRLSFLRAALGPNYLRLVVAGGYYQPADFASVIENVTYNVTVMFGKHVGELLVSRIGDYIISYQVEKGV